MPDRYLRIILTIIAIELGWLGLKSTATPLNAQQPALPTRVVIAGVEMSSVPVQTVGTVKIEADRPLKVENVHAEPAPRPGE